MSAVSDTHDQPAFATGETFPFEKLSNFSFVVLSNSNVKNFFLYSFQCQILNNIVGDSPFDI